MFDPTAFDNMKVVIEGALYDLDMSGEILVTDRNDWLNLAKMSRLFTISFVLRESRLPIHAKMELEAKLNNLAAELLQESLSEQNAGCYVKLQFSLELPENQRDFYGLYKIFQNIWGETRKISQSVEYNPLEKSKNISLIISIDFERIVKEEQMEDFAEMMEFMIATLQQLEEYGSGS
ncbi:MULTISPECIES: hypothetical protein [Neobacillus]|uniref:Uncharacterized protein n=1 Tax=Neobacillus rhizophilus TaxID=2833579 RepID=A0A942YZB3_9BACI|nr:MULTISPECIES: hypothetical protein [Neobacillus]MBS4215941.1 hypothetical protein [Neobacillus rhizophilus]MBU8916162.1 hypothetical protein [Bacillus sp. FJAT-29953]